MDELIQQIGDVMPEDAAARNFHLLLGILNNIVQHPDEAKYRSLRRSTLKDKLHEISIRVLEEIGFGATEFDLVLPAGCSTDTLQGAREILECLAMSCGDAGHASVAVDESVYSTSDEPMQQAPAVDEDDDLAAAMRLSMEGQAPAGEQTDREMAAALEKAEAPVAVAFERFNAEDRVIADDAVPKINEFLKAQSNDHYIERYVDPQFPPTNKSLYMDEADAHTWGCISCGARNPLPPVPPMAKTRDEAEAAEAHWQTINKCKGCGKPAHHVVNVRYFMRPTQWLRPAERCPGCEMLYSHLPAGKELTSRMCCHFLRDNMTNATVGAPWKLIRSEARCEDVCQGGLGNCWFAGALSTVALKPELIDNMFVTKEFNPYGAYHVRLCHAGEWCSILLDDLFPTSQIFEGYMDSSHAYYSLGGNLCYLGGARRQIWVPLIEKAAAKLHGSWGALESGTIREAMALFTGFPTQQIQGLYIRKEQRARLEQRRQARIEERTRLLLQGMEVPEGEDSDDDIDNDAITWSKIMSFNEAGYIMGMGCSEEAVEKTKDHIVTEMGLAAPHAYGIMDAREVEVDGKLTRFVKIRNPWGERAPRTWKGDWGKDSPKWTFDLQLKLGVVNKSGVKMDDDNSIFWMQFEDVKQYFAAIEVCRVHTDWHEVRERCWLPSGVGPGEAFDLTVFRKTQVDICAWQEKHVRRESAMGARSTNTDVGLAVLRQRAVGSDGQPEYELVEYVQRTHEDDCSAEMILDGGFVYRIVPISFGLMSESAPRRCVIAVHSIYKVELNKVSSSWHDVASAAFEGCRSKGRRRPVPNMNNGTVPGVYSYLRFEEGCGCCYAVENTTDVLTAIQCDASDAMGFLCTREQSMVISAIAPRSRQVVMGLTPNRRGSGEMRFEFSAVCVGAENAGFAMLGEQLHQPLPLLSPEIMNKGNRPQPDESILKRAPPEEEMSARKNRRKESNDAAESGPTEEELLAEAMKLSMAPQPGSGNGDAMNTEDDEDELAAALRLSMGAQPSASSQPANGASSSSTPAAAAPAQSAEDKKMQLQQKVKQLFEEYRRSGMPPNEAASKALAEAQRQMAGA